MEGNYQKSMEEYLHYSKYPRPEKHVLDNPGFNLARTVELTEENQLRVNVMRPLIVAKNIDYLYSNTEMKAIIDYIIVETLKVCPPNPAAFLVELFSKTDIRQKLAKRNSLYNTKSTANKSQVSYISSLEDITDWRKILEDFEKEGMVDEWLGKEDDDKEQGEKGSEKTTSNVESDSSRNGDEQEEEEEGEEENNEKVEEEEEEEDEEEEENLFENFKTPSPGFADEFNYFNFSDDSSDSSALEEIISCQDLLVSRKSKTILRKYGLSNDSKNNHKVSFDNIEDKQLLGGDDVKVEKEELEEEERGPGKEDLINSTDTNVSYEDYIEKNNT